MRLRRSELSTPGSSEKMLAKAAGSDADLVFCDLEDSVAPSQKPEARGLVVDALKSHDWGRKTRAVRINAVETPYVLDDIVEVVTGAGGALDLLIVPKVKAPRDVWFVETVLDKIARTPVALEVLIEEVEGLICCEEIARSSPRLEALIFGPGDLSASQGVRVSMIGEGGDVWHYARAKIVVAARAAGIEAVDGPFANFRDPDGYRAECVLSSAMGFTGKWAIHPSQIAIANEVYSPTARELDTARKLVSAYDEATAADAGAAAVGGVMIDAATVRIMRNVLDKQALIDSRAVRSP
jgi:citrate lyase subunit beta/citryl-CoA lyase